MHLPITVVALQMFEGVFNVLSWNQFAWQLCVILSSPETLFLLQPCHYCVIRKCSFQYLNVAFHVKRKQTEDF